MKLGLHRGGQHGFGARARARRARAGLPTSMAERGRGAGAPRPSAARRSAPTRELAERADVVVLCHKPAQLEEVAAEVGGAAQGGRLDPRRASPSRELEAAYPGIAGLPLHPEHPGRGRRGRPLLRAGRRAAEGPRRSCSSCSAAPAWWCALDEPLIEPAMALMSCGPAFLALVVEALADAGARHGLDAGRGHPAGRRDDGRHGRLPRANGVDTAELRRRVATPGGADREGPGGARGRRAARRVRATRGRSSWRRAR